VTLVCHPRSAAWLTSTVAARMVETSPRYRKRDMDGKQRTHCNTFLADVTTDLEAPVPWLLANEQIEWLDGPLAAREGWARCGLEEALVAIALGEVVVVGWFNPSGHGHVALGVPGTPGLGLHIAQAGSRNFSCRPVASGFGSNPVQLWRHA
jgi:hypothetical protein